jgi:NhaP-type Na+/H+ or K+/H+ antiporter/Trk K+ transport system NAD-binding subunit
VASQVLLTIALAVVAGLFAQVVAAHWRIPAIVPLLLIGMAIGPSGLGVIHPESLGAGLGVVVKLCVAVILFDGALNLRLSDLRMAIGEVRRLVTVGALVTWAGATLAALLVGGLSGPVALVFGALLTVTGPTVVQPILRRVRVSRRLKAVLEGEAILIDPIGAVLAVAVVHVVLGMAGVHPIGFFESVWAYAGRLIVGALVGVAAALFLSALLNRRGLVPADLANLVALAAVWGAFGISEAIKSESGITAVVAMGLSMQGGSIPEERRLRRFKEQLTVLGISLLFVLLSANLPLSVVREEGMRGVLTVVALMFVVRPLSVWAALRQSDLSWRDRAFVSWIAPRGIVAASVASLFAIELTEAGFAEGQRVLAITFLTIALTVTLQGLTAGPVARLLRLESLVGRRVIIVGAGPMAVALAKIFRQHGRPVAVIDRNQEMIAHARELGLEAVDGNALDESVLAAAGADDAETVLAMTTNPEVNALAAHLAQDAFGIRDAYPVLANPAHGASTHLLDRVGGRLAFGRPVDLRTWDYAIDHDHARVMVFRVPEGSGTHGLEMPDSIVLLARARDRSIEIATANTTWRAGDDLVLATMLDAGEATARLDDFSRSGAAPARVS